MYRKSGESFEECSRLSAGDGVFKNREHSIGTIVYDTSNDTAIANDDVNPNELMKRPTMPPIKPIGRKTANSDSVVAITARPISRVPSIAASYGVIPFSSMNL